MSSEIFEKNVGEMLRRAGLRPDEARAKGRFLREIEAPEERRSWKFAAAAAAILVVVTIVWSARSERPVDRTTGQSSTTRPPPQESRSDKTITARGGNELLGGYFVLRGRLKPHAVVFTGRTADQPGSGVFPEGMLFSVRLHKRSETLQAGRLVAFTSETRAGSEVLRTGEFSTEWTYRGPELVVVEVFINEALQEQDVAKRLKVPETKRSWTLEGSIWNQDVLGRLESQYPEALEVIRDLRAFVGRVQEACASELLFKSLEKELVAEAAKIQARAFALGRASLFPASAVQVQFAARDLAVAMPIFTWEDGKLAGPKSYHTNNQLTKTFRGDPFAFDAYRRYLDEALVAAGREFLLWLLRDAALSGFEEGHRKLLRDHAQQPGIEDLAPRLLQLPAVGADYAALEAEVRVLKK